MPIETPCNLDSLIDRLRLKVGDTDSTAYRYAEEWLRTALVSGVEYLSAWWNFKYLLDSDYNIYRNPNAYFIFDEDTYGVLEQGDDQKIIIAAAYILLMGSLESSAYDFHSWKDAEISYSNLEGSRTRNANVRKLWDELTSFMKPPQKRLARAKKSSLPGYINNEYERKEDI